MVRVELRSTVPTADGDKLAPAEKYVQALIGTASVPVGVTYLIISPRNR